MNKIIEDFLILDETLTINRTQYHKAYHIKTRAKALVKVVKKEHFRE